MQGTLFSGWIPFLLGGMSVLSFIYHVSDIQSIIFGHMGLWHTEKVRGGGGAHGSGPYLGCTHGLYWLGDTWIG